VRLGGQLLVPQLVLRGQVGGGTLGSGERYLAMAWSSEPKGLSGWVKVVGVLAGGQTLHQYGCSEWGLWGRLVVVHWADGCKGCLGANGWGMLTGNARRLIAALMREVTVPSRDRGWGTFLLATAREQFSFTLNSVL